MSILAVQAALLPMNDAALASEPKNLSGQSSSNSFRRTLRASIACTRSSSSSFARDIEAAKAAPGWHVVRRGLMEPKSADPALLQLELGARALRHGLQISFEPPGRKSRRADLRIQSDTAALNVECTSIQAFPDASDEASRVSWTLCPMIRRLQRS